MIADLLTLLVWMGAVAGVLAIAGAIVEWFEPPAQWVERRPPSPPVTITVTPAVRRALTYQPRP
jgi:hypothetical protein